MSRPLARALERPSAAGQITESALNVDPATGLFGILTLPRQALRDTGFIFMNPGLLHRVGPFRLYVDIARNLANAGFASLRLDQSGKGDSDALPGLAATEVTIANLRSAAECLARETGVRRFVVGGLCSGADDALQAGSQLEGLAGLFMFDGYVHRTARFYFHRYGPKLFSLQSWMKRLSFSEVHSKPTNNDIGKLRNWGTPTEMIERYRMLIDKGVYILAVFSGWNDNCYAYPSQFIESISHRQAATYAAELHIPGSTHLLHLSVHRQRAVDGVTGWATARFPEQV